MTKKTRALAFVLLAVLAVAALYETAIAVRWVSIGDEPGEGAPGEGFVVAAALLALVVGAFLLAVVPSRPAPEADALVSLITLAGAAFVVAHFYGFDPYFAPELRRFSAGVVAPWWIYTVGALAILSAIFSVTRPRLGLALGIPSLLLMAFTAFVTGLGH